MHVRDESSENTGVIPVFERQIHTYNSFGELLPEYYYESERFYSSGYRQLKDIVGRYRIDNPLSIVRRTERPAVFTGEAVVNQYRCDTPGLWSLWNTYEHSGTTIVMNHFSEEPLVSDQEFVTKACAVTNPSAAIFDSAVFIGELRDVPSLLKNAGQKLSKAGANEYLKFQYGWKPLYKDMKSLLKFTQRIDGRIKAVERLRENGKLRRKYEPKADMGGQDHQIVDYFSEWESNSFGSDVRNHMYGTIDVNRWCITEWKPEVPDTILPSFSSGISSDVRRALLGGTIDGSTLWNLMPWSWLADWSANFGDYLEANRNVVGAVCSGVTLCKHTEIRLQNIPDWRQQGSSDLPIIALPGQQASVYESSSGSAQPGVYVETRKERFTDLLPSVETTGEMNLFGKDLYKQSILGAIGVQRLRRLPF